MQNRLCGREQEYAMKIEPPDHPGLPKVESSTFVPLDNRDERWRASFVQAVLQRVTTLDIPNLDMRDNRLWLRNGSLIYIDLRSILEVASAEYNPCSLEGVLQEKASEMILNKALSAVVAQHKLDSFSLYKNTAGPKGDGDIFQEVSYASHHNYSYLTRKRDRVFAILKAFVPVSLPFTGSGHICKRGNAFYYTLSQRAQHIDLIESHNTLQDRGIINMRDESWVDRSIGYSRLHLIARDATRCEFQTWLVDAITHLILRLAEEVEDLDVLPPPLWSPVSELHAINFSAEASLNYQVQLQRGWLPLPGDRIDLITYNNLFLNAAKQLNPLSGEEKRVLEEWEQVLEILKARAFSKLVGKLDWVTKWELLKNKTTNDGYGLGDPRAWIINVEYHNISSDPNVSWFARLDERGYIHHLVNRQQIHQAIFTPPNTRAKSRGEFIRLFWKYPHFFTQLSSLDWLQVLFKGNSRIFYFGEKDNPFSLTSSSLEKLYKNLGIKYFSLA